jgi:hypothetical protein
MDRTITVEKDFEYKGRIYYYEAEVSYSYSYTPATYDSPEEEDFDADVNIYEVQDITDDEVRQIETITLEKSFEDAIYEDACDYAMTKHEEYNPWEEQ